MSKDQSKLREDYQKALQMKISLEQTLNELSKKIEDDNDANNKTKEVTKDDKKPKKVPKKTAMKQKKSSSLPDGWTLTKSGQISSPRGQLYKSRYVAVVDMVKRTYPSEDIEQMKQSMKDHEGWETSDYLPEGWMYKTIWEGFTSSKQYQYKCRPIFVVSNTQLSISKPNTTL